MGENNFYKRLSGAAIKNSVRDVSRTLACCGMLDKARVTWQGRGKGIRGKPENKGIRKGIRVKPEKKGIRVKSENKK